MDKNKKIELLKNKIDFIEELIKEYEPNKLRQWREETLMILDNLISGDSKYYTNFEKINFNSAMIAMGDPEGNLERHKEVYVSGLEKAKSSLQAIIYGVQNDLV